LRPFGRLFQSYAEFVEKVLPAISAFTISTAEATTPEEHSENVAESTPATNVTENIVKVCTSEYVFLRVLLVEALVT
jgi:hypothetical protein